MFHVLLSLSLRIVWHYSKDCCELSISQWLSHQACVSEDIQNQQKKKHQIIRLLFMPSESTDVTFKLFDIHGLPGLGEPYKLPLLFKKNVTTPKLKANMDPSKHLFLLVYVYSPFQMHSSYGSIKHLTTKTSCFWPLGKIVKHLI